MNMDQAVISLARALSESDEEISEEEFFVKARPDNSGIAWENIDFSIPILQILGVEDSGS